MSPFLSGMDTARRPTGPWLALVVVVLAMLVLGGAGSFAASLLLTGSPTPQTGNLRGQVAMLIGGFAPVALALWLWIRFKEGRPFASAGFTGSPRGLGLGALAAFLAFSAIVFTTVLSGQTEFGAGPRWSLLPGTLLALVAYAIQGSTEELLCRGFLLQALTRKWGVPAAVAVQAGLFAALHTGNVGGLQVLAVLNLVLYGLFTAGWAIAEGGLWGVCGFHLMWNWVQGNVFGAAVSGTAVDTALLTLHNNESGIVNGAAFGLEASVVTTVVLALGCALVYRPARGALRG